MHDTHQLKNIRSSKLYTPLYIRKQTDSQLSRRQQVLMTADHATDETCTKFNYFKCWLTVFLFYIHFIFQKLHYSKHIIMTKSSYGCHSDQTDRQTDTWTERQILTLRLNLHESPDSSDTAILQSTKQLTHQPHYIMCNCTEHMRTF